MHTKLCISLCVTRPCYFINEKLEIQSETTCQLVTYSIILVCIFDYIHQ